MRNSTPLWCMERDITTFENSLEGIVSKRKHSRYRSGRSRHWLEVKNPNAPAVKREAEDDGGRLPISYSAKLKRVAPGLMVMTIIRSSMLTDSSSGAFLRLANRLQALPG